MLGPPTRDRTQSAGLKACVSIKASLYRKAVQVYHIPIITTYSPSVFGFVRGSPFEQPLNTRPPSLPGHQAHQTGLCALGARCNRWKNSNHQCHGRGSNLGRLPDRPTLYHVAIKAGLYRKAVQVYHIPITTTSLLFSWKSALSGALLISGNFYWISSPLCTTNLKLPR